MHFLPLSSLIRLFFFLQLYMIFRHH